MFSSLLAFSALSLGVSAQSLNDSSVFTKYTISAPGINASFIPYGACLTNLFVPDRNGDLQDVVLGYDSGTTYLNDTETDHTYFGAVVGRYANRIKNGTFTVQYAYFRFSLSVFGSFFAPGHVLWKALRTKNDSRPDKFPQTSDTDRGIVIQRRDLSYS